MQCHFKQYSWRGFLVCTKHTTIDSRIFTDVCPEAVGLVLVSVEDGAERYADTSEERLPSFSAVISDYKQDSSVVGCHFII